MQWSFDPHICGLIGPVDMRSSPGFHGVDPNLFLSYWEAWGTQQHNISRL